MRAPRGRAAGRTRGRTRAGRRMAAATGAAAVACALAAGPASAGGVTGFALPAPTAAGHPDSTQLVVPGVQAIGPHTAGTPYLEAKPNGSVERGRTFDAPALAAGPTSSLGATVTLGGLMPWRTYQLAGCFRDAPPSYASSCGAARTVVTGYVSSGATPSVFGTYATVSGAPSAPYPAGRLAYYLGTKDPLDEDPRLALTRNGGFAIPARTATVAATTPIAGTFTHLAKLTSYWWTVCFDTPAEPGIEACAPVRKFTTGTKDPIAKDKVKPKVKLKLTGKVVRGGRLKLTVTATDAGGVKRVRIKVGGAATQTLRHKTIRLPKRRATVKIVVTVTDTAGNVTTVRKSVKVR